MQTRYVAEFLERRVLLAGGAPPATQLLASFAPSNNVEITESLVVGQTLFVTGNLNGSTNERLWSLPPGATSPIELIHSVTSGDGGITGLSQFQGKLHFFVNSSIGDGLFRTDGTLAGTNAVKILRVGSANVLPSGTFVLNGRLHFFWNT